VRILQVAPPWFTVPPAGYGGTETVVSLLVEGLIDAGHEVHLLASAGSVTRAELRTVYQRPPAELLGDVATELGHVLAAYVDPGEVDLIHDHSGLVGPALGALADGPPVVHTLHSVWSAATRRVYGHLADRISLVAISEDQARRRPPGLRLAGVVHNAISLVDHPAQLEPVEGPLTWIGRANPDKGPLDAIEVARRLGRPLVLAMKVNEAAEHVYYREVIEPALIGVDAEVRFDVKLPAKAELLGRSSCLLFPVRWPEPFGLVMLEAMACGTPVAAYANGAVPEVVVHGRTGVLVPEGDLDGLCDAVERAATLDRGACRAHVEARFSPSRMVADYLAIYDRVLHRRPPLVRAG
jgi:glycosyltransferase involved in cell wall biosynthesis